MVIVYGVQTTDFHVTAFTSTAHISVSSSPWKVGYCSVTVVVLTVWPSTPPITGRVCLLTSSHTRAVPVEAFSVTVVTASPSSFDVTRRTTVLTAATSETAQVSRHPWTFIAKLYDHYCHYRLSLIKSRFHYSYLAHNLLKTTFTIRFQQV